MFMKGRRGARQEPIAVIKLRNNEALSRDRV